MQFFRSVAQALLDFNELNPIAPLQLLLEVSQVQTLLSSSYSFVHRHLIIHWFIL